MAVLLDRLPTFEIIKLADPKPEAKFVRFISAKK